MRKVKKKQVEKDKQNSYFKTSIYGPRQDLLYDKLFYMFLGA